MPTDTGKHCKRWLT